MLPASTHLGCVRLRVSSIERSLDFYAALLGLRAERDQPTRAKLYVQGASSPLLLLEEDTAAKHPSRSTGLFHIAILLPRRKDLGKCLRRLSESGWPLHGGSDHAVSEALYLADAEGNGVELYADRPRDKWPREDGQVAMGTYPLDVGSVLAEADLTEETWTGLPEGTRMGHVHLRVSSIDEGEVLFVRVIGFDIVTRRYSGALFMSAGGYHHHVAINTWGGTGLPAPPPRAAGLIDFEVVVPDTDRIAAIATRARDEGVQIESEAQGEVVLQHAGGIRVRVVSQGIA